MACRQVVGEAAHRVEARRGRAPRARASPRAPRRIAARAASPFSRLRQAITTCAPARASSRAVDQAEAAVRAGHDRRAPALVGDVRRGPLLAHSGLPSAPRSAARLIASTKRAGGSITGASWSCQPAFGRSTQRAIRTVSSSTRSTRSSSRSSPARPGLAPYAPASAAPSESPAPASRIPFDAASDEQRGHVRGPQLRRAARDLAGLPAGEPQAARHALEPHLDPAFVGAGGGVGPHASWIRTRRAVLRTRPDLVDVERGLRSLRRGRIEHGALRADRALGGQAVVTAEARQSRDTSALVVTATIRPVSTAVVSDLHLGLLNGTDVVSMPAVRERLLAALAGADHVVLLGDVLELRERRVAEMIELCAALLRGARGGDRRTARDDRARQPRPRASRRPGSSACAWTAASSDRSRSGRWSRTTGRSGGSRRTCRAPRCAPPTRGCGCAPTSTRPTATTSTCR